MRPLIGYISEHEFIDILKIDIESWEFDTLTTLVKSYIEQGKPLPFGQLQLEIHAWQKTFDEFLGWWEMLEEAGLRPFWTEVSPPILISLLELLLKIVSNQPNMVYVNYNRGSTADLAEYSFLNVKGDNVFIKDPRPSINNSEHTNQ